MIKLNKIVFTAVIAGLLSSTAFAQGNQPKPDQSNLIVLAQAEQSPVQQDPVSVKDNAEGGFIDLGEAKRRNAEISDLKYQEEKLKIDLSVATMKSEIAKLSNGSDDNDSAKKDDKTLQELELLKAKVDELSLSQQKSAQPQKKNVNKHDFQVTKIYGVDGNYLATVYYNGTIFKKRAGESINDKVVIKSVSADKVVAVVAGKTSTYYVKSLAFPEPESSIEMGSNYGTPIMSIPIPKP